MITIKELGDDEVRLLRTIPANQGLNRIMWKVRATIALWQGKPVMCNCYVEDL